MKTKYSRIYFSLALIIFSSLFIKAGCSKSNDDVSAINEQMLKAAWQVQAFRYGADSTNANGWQTINYNKITTVFDLYCVYDSRVQQSFLSRLNCAYDETPTSSIGVDPSGCGRTVYARDTTWMQQTKNEISFLSNQQFSWIETLNLSKHINTVRQPCSNITYVPESEDKSEVTGQWTFDQAAGVVTVDYTPGFSRLDGQAKNQFKITALSDNSIIIKLLNGGDELRLQRL